MTQPAVAATERQASRSGPFAPQARAIQLARASWRADAKRMEETGAAERFELSKAGNDASLWRLALPGHRAPCRDRADSEDFSDVGLWGEPTLPALKPFDALAPGGNPMPPPRLVFSKYRLLARLGSGGMADVFLALSGHGSEGFHKLLVLKVLRPDLPAQERADFFKMFQDEGRLAMRLSHPAIVQAYEVGSEGAFSFIAMEYLEGQPLSAIQDRGWSTAPGISSELQIQALCQVLDGLEYAHALTDYHGRKLNIVHRDVSPQNVFVTYSGHTKLVDFGIAKTLDSNSKTAAGVVKGKLLYMSPEQIRSRQVDQRADLFSVGVMLWEAVAGRSMHGGSSLYDILQRLVSGDLPRLRDAVPDVDRRLDEIVSRALSCDPDRRYEHAGALRDDLLGFLESRPKVSLRELGERVAQMFEPERQAIGEVIRHALSGSPSEVAESTVDRAAELPPLAVLANPRLETGRVTVPTAPPGLRSALPWVARAPEDVPEAAGGEPRASDSSPSPLAAIAVVAAQMSRRQLAFRAGGAALALLVLAALLLRSPGSRGPVTLGPTTPEAPFRSQLEPRATVQLSLVAHPDAAVFTLDGQTLQGNPYRGERPLDGDPHTLAVNAAGHQPRQVEISLSRDVDLEVRLIAAEPAAARLEPEPVTAPEAASVSERRPPTPPAPAAPRDDENLYPDFQTKNPRARPRLDTSESPW